MAPEKQLKIEEASAIFQETFGAYPGFWCVAGGWAIDLFLERQTRPHEDLEVVALRQEGEKLFRHLKPFRPQKIFAGDPPRFELWQGETIPSEVIQLRLGQITPAVDFDVLLTPSEQSQWICRRDESIRLPLGEIYQHSKSGVPYLKPEIVLLFKAKYAEEKDQADFDNAIPDMNQSAIIWLLSSLGKVYKNHRWLDALRNSI